MEKSFGKYLRQQRELREISLQEVSQRTKIKKQFLIALEEDRFDELPGMAFVRGFISAYAQEIGLDPAQVLLQFEEFLRKNEPEEKESPPKFSTKKLILFLGIFIFLLMSLIGAIWVKEKKSLKDVQDELKRKTEKLSAVAKAQAKAKFSESKELSSPYLVVVEAKELCWLLATMDDSKTREATLYPGERIEFNAKERLSLLIGNAGGVDVYVNSVKLKPLGAHWKPVRVLIPDELDKYVDAQKNPAKKPQQKQTQ